MKELENLIELDSLQTLSYFDKKGFIHNSHRFLLPLVLFAQRNKILPQPCNLIVFDKHHDFCDPLKLSEVKNVDIKNISIEAFISFCDKDLRQLNDDWIKAGMEMGLFKDLVIFGVQQDFRFVSEYVDSKTIKHNVYITSSHPGDMFGHCGRLVDHARQEALEYFWNIIGWSCFSGFVPKDNLEPFILDFDLDCFSMEWEEFTFPWDQEVYAKKYLSDESDLFESNETGKAFLQALINRSSLFTIAKEPSCCGGEDKCSKIWNDFNKNIFDNEIKVIRQ